MAVAALVIYLVLGVLTFGVRIAVQWRRTGDTGFRGISGRPGSVEWWGGIGFVVALVLCVAAPVADLAGMAPIALLDHRWTNVLGVVAAGTGVVLTLAAQLSMGDAWRIGVDPTERTALVAAGAFAIVRNPIYSAMLVTVFGLAAMVPNGLALAGIAALIGALEVQVRRVEEPFLRSVHGEAYARYAAAVGRFVPGVGRDSKGERFSDRA